MIRVRLFACPSAGPAAPPVPVPLDDGEAGEASDGMDCGKRLCRKRCEQSRFRYCCLPSVLIWKVTPNLSVTIPYAGLKNVSCSGMFT